VSGHPPEFLRMEWDALSAGTTKPTPPITSCFATLLCYVMLCYICCSPVLDHQHSYLILSYLLYLCGALVTYLILSYLICVVPWSKDHPRFRAFESALIAPVWTQRGEEVESIAEIGGDSILSIQIRKTIRFTPSSNSG